MTDRNLFSPDGATALSPMPDSSLLGNVLTVSARLVAEGLLPAEVVEERPAAYALCLVSRDGTTVRVLHTGDTLEVGRAPSPASANWAVADPWMSARHFSLAIPPDALPSLRPLAPKNGLFVNDRPVDALTVLRRGDVIRAGTSSFLVL